MSKQRLCSTLTLLSTFCSIVFANKTVFSVLGFQFVYTLTLLHVLTTLGGMHLFAILGLYEPKKLPFRPLLSLSAAFVGYIVFWNLALKVHLLYPSHVLIEIKQRMQLTMEFACC